MCVRYMKGLIEFQSERQAGFSSQAALVALPHSRSLMYARLRRIASVGLLMISKTHGNFKIQGKHWFLLPRFQIN